jgi:hypothetical protein
VLLTPRLIVSSDTLVRTKSNYEIDGAPFVVGIATILKQLHPTVTQQVGPLVNRCGPTRSHQGTRSRARACVKCHHPCVLADCFCPPHPVAFEAALALRWAVHPAARGCLLLRVGCLDVNPSRSCSLSSPPVFCVYFSRLRCGPGRQCGGGLAALAPRDHFHLPSFGCPPPPLHPHTLYAACLCRAPKSGGVGPEVLNALLFVRKLGAVAVVPAAVMERCVPGYILEAAILTETPPAAR